MQYRVAVGLHYTFLKARELSQCVKRAILVGFVVYVLSGGDILACTTKASSFMANKLLCQVLVYSDAVVSLLPSNVD